MPRHVLLLAHGMGLHGDDWIEGDSGPVETLKRVSRRYVFFQKTPLEKYVEFVPISYDDVFRSVVAEWQSGAKSITALGGSALGPLPSWLDTAAETEKNFWWTHSADVALYRCFESYRNAVRAHVIRDVSAAIGAAGNTRISVLAHSLGTAVMHDSLHLLGTLPSINGVANAFRATAFRFDSIMMIANTSRLLQTKDPQMRPAYESVVRPGKSADPDSYCSRYLNFRHEADPVPFPRMFEPAGWDPERFSSALIRHYWQANVHDVSHYLMHPRVHIPILRALTKDAAVSHAEEIAAVNPDNFPQIGGSFAFVNKVGRLIARLDELKQELGDNPPTDVLSRAFTQYSAVVREAA